MNAWLTTAMFVTSAIFLFVTIPYLGVRDLRNNPESHQHGLSIAIFLALSMVFVYIILYGLCLIGTPKMETPLDAIMWFVVILFIVFGSVLSIIMLFLYTIAHTKKKYGEQNNRWTLWFVHVVMALATTWTLLTEGYALFRVAQELNTGAMLDPLKMYQVFVFRFNAITPIMALFLNWVTVAVWLNVGRKNPAHA